MYKNDTKSQLLFRMCLLIYESADKVLLGSWLDIIVLMSITTIKKKKKSKMYIFKFILMSYFIYYVCTTKLLNK
jgi:hypothetical protein